MLDYVLIFVVGLGVKGAAAATVTAQVGSWLAAVRVHAAAVAGFAAVTRRAGMHSKWLKSKGDDFTHGSSTGTFQNTTFGIVHLGRIKTRRLETIITTIAPEASASASTVEHFQETKETNAVLRWQVYNMCIRQVWSSKQYYYFCTDTPFKCETNSQE